MKEYYHVAINAIHQAGVSDMNEEQEIAAFIANLAIGIYASESAILRTEKAIEKSGIESNGQKLDCSKVFIHEISQQNAIAGLNLLNHFNHHEEFLHATGRLVASSKENIVEVKRRIAQRVIAAERYVV